MSAPLEVRCSRCHAAIDGTISTCPACGALGTTHPVKRRAARIRAMVQAASVLLLIGYLAIRWSIISRQLLAEYLEKVGLVLVLSCLAAIKIPLLPERVHNVALWGLLIAFVLILLRLSLLAFGD